MGFRLVRTIHPTSCNPDPCHGHATSCDETGSVVTCTCEDAYTGRYCNRCAFGSSIAYPDCFLPGEGYCDSNQCFPVPPTGQISCYNNSSSVDCSTIGGSEAPDCSITPGDCDTNLVDACFCGQDTQYQDRSRSFTCYNDDGSIQDPCDGSASTDEVVVDSLTGLMWQRTIAGGKKTWQGAKDYCETTLNEGSGYAGYTNWRLPNYHELKNIANYNAYDPGIDLTVFPGTPGDWFWSSSPRAGDASKAWMIHFDRGMTESEAAEADVTDYSWWARCVRGGPSFDGTGDGGRYIENNQVPEDPIVIDLVTGLSWQNNLESGKNWQEALEYCESLDYGGHQDWRVPDVNELTSLVDVGEANPASEFPDIDHTQQYWASTTFFSGPTIGWWVRFSDGQVNAGTPAGFKTNDGNVLCVRGGP